MLDVPQLETDRLRLRQPSMEDWPVFAELMLSQRAVYMGGPFTIDRAWGIFCHGIALWQLMGYGSLSIEHRETGQCLGQIEINHGPLFPETELGWQLYSFAEGHGYAFEAALAMRQWAFEVRKLETLVSYIDPENLRSRKLAERLGAELDNNAARQDPTDLVFRHRPHTPRRLL